MANTPNINLVKPLGTDKALVSVINDNSDKIDAFAGSANTNMANTQNGYAIVVDGNNAPKAITAGQYLFIKNHSTLSAGGYHATANIANGAAVTSSNVAADADGVVNGAFSALNGKFSDMTLGVNVHSESDAPSEYPLGISMFSVQDGSGSYGWNTTTGINYAIVVTFKATSAYALQIIANYQGKMNFRASTISTGWESWKTVTT